MPERALWRTLVPCALLRSRHRLRGLTRHRDQQLRGRADAELLQGDDCRALFRTRELVPRSRACGAPLIRVCRRQDHGILYEFLYCIRNVNQLWSGISRKCAKGKAGARRGAGLAASGRTLG